MSQGAVSVKTDPVRQVYYSTLWGGAQGVWKNPFARSATSLGVSPHHCEAHHLRLVATLFCVRLRRNDVSLRLNDVACVARKWCCVLRTQMKKSWKRCFQDFLEVPPGFEPGIEVLQTFALPLGYGTIFSCFNIIAEKNAFVNRFFKISWNNLFHASFTAFFQKQTPPPLQEKSTHLSTKTMCAFFNEICPCGQVK